MKFKLLYIGTIIGWVLIVLLEIIGSFSGTGHKSKKSKLPIRLFFSLLKNGRRTILFSIAIVNLLLLVQKKQ